MGEFLQGFLDNDSFFGRFMTKCGIIIGANLLFVLCCLPGITIGAGLTATYYVMLRTLRKKDAQDTINPFREFWEGFRRNFRQATLCFLGFLALLGLGLLDLAFCRAQGGIWLAFTYGIYALLLILLILYIYLQPVMAAFEDSIPHLLRNAFFFAIRKPGKLLVILFFNAAPMVLTYSDLQMLPLYAFLWCFFGFAAIAMLGSTLLLPEFAPYLGHGRATARNRRRDGDKGDGEGSAGDSLELLTTGQLPRHLPGTDHEEDGESAEEADSDYEGFQDEAAMLEDLRKLDGI